MGYRGQRNDQNFNSSFLYASNILYMFLAIFVQIIYTYVPLSLVFGYSPVKSSHVKRNADLAAGRRLIQMNHLHSTKKIPRVKVDSHCRRCSVANTQGKGSLSGVKRPYFSTLVEAAFGTLDYWGSAISKMDSSDETIDWEWGAVHVHDGTEGFTATPSIATNTRECLDSRRWKRLPNVHRALQYK